MMRIERVGNLVQLADALDERRVATAAGYDRSVIDRVSGRAQKGAAKGVTQGRAPWGTLSRQHVIEAAVRAVREGRYEQMTIRSLAADMGVAPMSLYRHVRDRDDLLDEVTDRLLSGHWRPRRKCATWQEWITEAAKRFRQLLVTQPAVLHVYLSHPVATPAALDRMTGMLNVLRDAGFNDESALRAYAALHTYTIGFASLEASRSKWDASSAQHDATMKQLAAFTTAKQFTDGLEFILRGIERSE